MGFRDWKVVESPGTLECVKSRCFGGCQRNLQQVAPLAYEHAELSNPLAYEHAEPMGVNSSLHVPFAMMSLIFVVKSIERN